MGEHGRDTEAAECAAWADEFGHRARITSLMGLTGLDHVRNMKSRVRIPASGQLKLEFTFPREQRWRGGSPQRERAKILAGRECCRTHTLPFIDRSNPIRPTNIAGSDTSLLSICRTTVWSTQQQHSPPAPLPFLVRMLPNYPSILNSRANDAKDREKALGHYEG